MKSRNSSSKSCGCAALAVRLAQEKRRVSVGSNYDTERLLLDSVETDKMSICSTVFSILFCVQHRFIEVYEISNSKLINI